MSPEVCLELWEYADAPDHLREIVPHAYIGGWLAFIYPGGGEELMQALIDRCHSLGVALAQCRMDDGGVVLAGHHREGKHPWSR